MRKVLSATVFSLLLGSPLQAQIQVALSPMAGGYIPVADLFERLSLGGGGGGATILNLGQEMGPLFGGRIAIRFTRLAIEAEAGYALSNLDLPEEVVEAGVDDGASVFLGSLNLLYDIFQAPLSPLSLHLSAGGGLVARGGRFLDRFDGTTSVAGAFGLGARFGLSPLASFRFDMRDYVSSFSPSTLSGLDLGSQIQNDLILTVAIEFSFAPTAR